MLKGYGKLGSRLDTRMPITLLILCSILQQTPTICRSDYRTYLFTATRTTPCFGFSRVGEIICCPKGSVIYRFCPRERSYGRWGREEGLAPVTFL